jgi:hypothetical protein
LTGPTTLIRIHHGSYLFGTSTPTSDQDYKSVVVPSAREIMLGNRHGTTYDDHTTKQDMTAKNSPDDVDEQRFTFRGFIKMLEEGQTVALELLFCPKGYQLEVHQQWTDMVLSCRDELIHRGVGAFFGYARQQASKYGIKGSRVAAVRATLELLKGFDQGKKLEAYTKEDDRRLVEFVRDHGMRPALGEDPLIQIVLCRAPHGGTEPHLEVCGRKVPYHATVKYAVDVFQRIFDEYGRRALAAERNEGVDWKALSHAVRVGDQAIELLTTGQMTFPRPNASLLLAIKRGELAYETVANMIESRLVEMTAAQKDSCLPDGLNRARLDDMVVRMHTMQVAGLL